MIRGLLNSTTVPLLEQVARFGERRHEVLAGNIANINTPDYLMQDLPVDEFQQALVEAVQARHRTAPVASLAGTASPAGSETGGDPFPAELFEPVTAAPQNARFRDGNNRSIEFQVMELTKNALMQRYAVELLMAQMNVLESVIREQP